MAVNQLLTIPKGSEVVGVDRRTCVNVLILNDDQQEENEVFTITFTPVTAEDEFGSGGPYVSITIRDDNDSKSYGLLVLYIVVL